MGQRVVECGHMIAATRVEVRRGKNESTSALIRRFSRRAQGLGLVREMRDRRYFKRYKSKNVEHKRALITATRRDRYNELVKLGKIDPAARQNRRGAKR
jgi:ribosomal protein S21